MARKVFQRLNKGMPHLSLESLETLAVPLCFQGLVQDDIDLRSPNGSRLDHRFPEVDAKLAGVAFDLLATLLPRTTPANRESLVLKLAKGLPRFPSRKIEIVKGLSECLEVHTSDGAFSQTLRQKVLPSLLDAIHGRGQVLEVNVVVCVLKLIRQFDQPVFHGKLEDLMHLVGTGLKSRETSVRAKVRQGFVQMAGVLGPLFALVTQRAPVEAKHGKLHGPNPSPAQPPTF